MRVVVHIDLVGLLGHPQVLALPQPLQVDLFFVPIEGLRFDEAFA